MLNTENRREKMVAALGGQIIEPLEEFLTICLSYERTQSGMLRHFMKWFIEGGSEIKRETSAADGVRIATTHSSKGLEAPIVFFNRHNPHPTTSRKRLCRSFLMDGCGLRAPIIQICGTKQPRLTWIKKWQNTGVCCM